MICTDDAIKAALRARADADLETLPEYRNAYALGALAVLATQAISDHKPTVERALRQIRQLRDEGVAILSNQHKAA